MQIQRARRTIAVHAPGGAFAPGAQSALVRLGYNLVTASTAERQSGENDLLRPLLRIVDDRQLDELPVERAPLPLVLLTSASGPVSTDARAVGCVRRRARLGDLYPLIQRALESTPRDVPRIEDAIPARCTRDGREWTGLIRSLSERGCLLESARPLEKDLRVEISFPLAGRGLVRLPAQPAYVDGARAGLVFRRLSDLHRASIADYVASRLGG
jgi:hypothetical protein